jgi:hypothetical protein
MIGKLIIAYILIIKPECLLVRGFCALVVRPFIKGLTTGLEPRSCPESNRGSAEEKIGKERGESRGEPVKIGKKK